MLPSNRLMPAIEMARRLAEVPQDALAVDSDQRHLDIRHGVARAGDVDQDLANRSAPLMRDLVSPRISCVLVTWKMLTEELVPVSVSRAGADRRRAVDRLLGPIR